MNDAFHHHTASHSSLTDYTVEAAQVITVLMYVVSVAVSEGREGRQDSTGEELGKKNREGIEEGKREKDVE